MINLDVTGKQTIHTRRIDIATCAGDSESIIVEGVLHDERLADSYRPDGKKLPPGTVHHMIIRMSVRGPKLVIEDIEVEMPTVPREECRETLDSLLPLKGLPIISGFTNRVKDLVGGYKRLCPSGSPDHCHGSRRRARGLGGDDRQASGSGRDPARCDGKN